MSTLKINLNRNCQKNKHQDDGCDTNIVCQNQSFTLPTRAKPLVKVKHLEILPPSTENLEQHQDVLHDYATFATMSTEVHGVDAPVVTQRREHRKNRSAVKSDLHYLSSFTLCLIVFLALALGTMIPRVTYAPPHLSSNPDPLDVFHSMTNTDIGIDSNLHLGDLLTHSFVKPSSLFSPITRGKETQSIQSACDNPAPIMGHPSMDRTAGSPVDGLSHQPKMTYNYRPLRWFTNRIRLMLMHIIRRFVYGQWQ